MTPSSTQNVDRHGSAASMRGGAPNAPSAEDTRRLILRSRAISEGEARLAAAINDVAPHGRPQTQEDAFTLPRRATSVDPAGKT